MAARMIITRKDDGTVEAGGERFPEGKVALGRGTVRLSNRDTDPIIVCDDKAGLEKYRLSLARNGDYLLSLQEGTWLPSVEQADEIARAAAFEREMERSRIAAERRQRGVGYGAFVYMSNNGHVAYLRSGETLVDSERAAPDAAKWSSDGHIERTTDGGYVRVVITGATWALFGKRLSSKAVVWGDPSTSLFMELGAETLGAEYEARERTVSPFQF